MASFPDTARVTPRSPLGLWLAATVAAAMIVSVADTLLIGRTRGLFTGGFLSAEHLDTWSERALYAVLSLLSDAALTGVIAAVALAIGRRWRLRTDACLVLALFTSCGPLLIADVVSYQLFAYLGDAFDVGLMFELTGHSVRELLVVASDHLILPALLVTVAGASVVGVVAVVHRVSSLPPLSGSISIFIPLALLAVGFSVHAGARISSDLLDDALRRKPAGQLFGAVAEGLTDVDRDNYGVLRQPRDPDWFDGAVYPYAIDWPGNGVDEDGIGGDLPAGAPYREAPAGPPRFTVRPTVVLVVLESLRADAVGAEHNGKRVTPTIDALARTGAAAVHAYSHNGYTTRSRQHIFSGSLANLRGDTTLIDDFKANGYEVAYFSAQDETFGGEDLSIHADRADVFYDARRDANRRFTTFSSAGSLAVPSGVVLERVEQFLTARDRSRPLFLYVNFQDTHFPYWHSGIRPLVDDTVVPQGQIAPARADDLRRMYLNTVANVDAAIGDLLALVRRSLDAPPAVIVTSDHGESLYDGGFLGHGYALNDAQTRVPLVVNGLPVQLPDLFPQSDIRAMLWQALAPAVEKPPLEPLLANAVFQYLGSLERPRQIALTGAARQRVFDFREGKASINGGDWMVPAELAPEESAAFLGLVQLWERLRLAAVNSGQGATGTQSPEP